MVAEPTTDSRKDMAGVFLFVVGVILISISTVMQMFSMSNGSSGQVTIQSTGTTTLWPVLTGVVLLGVGFFLYFVVLNDAYKTYRNLFVLAFFSYIMSNVALMFCTTQVKVTKT
jgi:uncharacterized BrkB/YihY/UPF0761 family membrane protein